MILRTLKVLFVIVGTVSTLIMIAWGWGQLGLAQRSQRAPIVATYAMNQLMSGFETYLREFASPPTHYPAGFPVSLVMLQQQGYFFDRDIAVLPESDSGTLVLSRAEHPQDRASPIVTRWRYVGKGVAIGGPRAPQSHDFLVFVLPFEAHLEDDATAARLLYATATGRVNVAAGRQIVDLAAREDAARRDAGLPPIEWPAVWQSLCPVTFTEEGRLRKGSPALESVR